MKRRVIPILSMLLITGSCVLGTFPSAAHTMSNTRASDSNGEYAVATTANAVLLERTVDIWSGYLDGSVDSLDGKGTKKAPYLLSSAEDLKFLAYQVANEDVDGFSGCYFKLTKDISLSGNQSWLPIGYYDGEMQLHPFMGYFDGNGCTISNLSISDTEQDYAGFFGYTDGATICNLKVSGKISASNNVGMVVGRAYNTSIKNCSSSGQVRASGALGGIAGEIYDSTVYNCKNTALVLGGGLDTTMSSVVGGICGAAHNSVIHSCIQATSDSGIAGVSSERITGGLIGSLNNSELYNSTVSGKIGSMSSKVIGGLVGEMSGGKLMINRFSGTLAVTVSGVIPDAGLFVGKVGNNVALGDSLQYLYTDAEEKFYINPFGNRLNGLIRPEHHIGVYYTNNSYSIYSPVSSPVFDVQSNYFFEELETGVLGIDDRDLDHWAPSKNGSPTKGFLVTVPEIPNGTISVMEAQNVYAHEITPSNPGAIAWDRVVNVTTSPINNPPVFYELENGSLRWYAANGSTDSEEILHGAYGFSFLMPEKNIMLDAVYRAMTNGVVLDKNELTVHIKQIRSGIRTNPDIQWEVSGPQRLSYTIIPDEVINKNVVWSITGDSSTDIVSVDKDGVVKTNKDARWITDAITEAITLQTEKPYMKIPATKNTETCNVVVTTVAGGKQAECKVIADFVIEDNTYVPVTEVSLNEKKLDCKITKTLSGPKKNPTTTYTITELPKLIATILPTYADNRNISWYSDTPELLRVIDGVLMVIPEALEEGSKTVQITVITEDGGLKANCEIAITLEEVDKTTSNSSGGGSGSSGDGSSSGGRSSKGTVSSKGPGLKKENIYAGTWNNENNQWSLILPNGEHAKSQWAFLEGKWYYLDQSGVMLTDWQKIDGSWFFMWPNGSLANGWLLNNNRWYYLDQSGVMLTGWQQVNGKWYYLLPDGSMAANTTTPDGYYVDTYGVWR